MTLGSNFDYNEKAILKWVSGLYYHFRAFSTWLLGKFPLDQWLRLPRGIVRHFNVNTLRPRQNWRHFADAIFKSIFLNVNILIPIIISLKFFPKVLINTALVQIMAWRHPGDKPLFEPIILSLPTQICVSQPQWVNKGNAGQRMAILGVAKWQSGQLLYRYAYVNGMW